jgi:mono/diheme cytochrome c family protein
MFSRARSQPTSSLCLAAGLALGLATATLDGCASTRSGGFTEDAGPSGSGSPGAAKSTKTGLTTIPQEAQRTNGDPKKGYDYLVNGGYISVGIPWSGFHSAMTPLQDYDALPGRTGKNAEVGYAYNVTTNQRGEEIAALNCLLCHATHLNGELVVGLGRPQRSYATPSGTAPADPYLIGMGLRTPSDLLEYQLFGTRFNAAQEAGPLILFGAQAAHRDPRTLAWSSTTRFDARTGLQGFVDVPPWWRTKKKNALYYSGMGRGDQVFHMMNMTIFSADSVDEAKQIETMFVDVAAFLRSIEPPKFPGKIDTARASKGKTIFEANCASCHGTYGEGGSYPNVIVPVESVGTDPGLAVDSWVSDGAREWWNASWYGQASRYEKTSGYMAPPLDGIWATAPFFHNGSVPTLEGVVDSSKRPATWSTAFGDADYDLDAVGWALGQGDVYDTTQPGLANTGHTYGDSLDDASRTALIEYLKTL